MTKLLLLAEVTVYYMVGDYDKLFDTSLDKLSEKVLKEANLLWEK